MSSSCRVIRCFHNPWGGRGCSLALVAIAWLAAVRPLAAQDIWLATEIEIADEAKDPALVARVAETLRAKGHNVMSSAAAASEFSRHHSRAAARPSNEELKLLDEALREL